ncbi:unnamed protein product [Adineta steineri]|uniref:Fungal lipase-type domain-containing protein n=1 Tax=Adineta steineri TaxID=433720 RepID=A0A813SFC1_9BILA|nr:unnamed protein product [Adineta steineri]CAF0796255.1 unnamed protein product [Adineta steineri]
MIFYTYICFLLHILIISSLQEKSLLGNIIRKELGKFQCDIHDFTSTYKNEFQESPFRNRSIKEITASWQSTFPEGNYRTNTKNSIPFSRMNLREPDTILRMAEYQAMIYCKSTMLGAPSDISSIRNMAKKNLRVGNFTIEATGFDRKRVSYWYIASNIAQQSIILVHRGTKTSNPSDVFDDLDRFNIHNTHGLLNRDFSYLSSSKDVYVDSGFYQRFQHEKTAIVSALRPVLSRYSNPAFSFIVVGHSLGASWAFLNAAYFASQNDINQRMSAIYTFGQPLLGSAAFVNEITKKLNTPNERYVRVVNGNDMVPHIGCGKCIQPEYANEKWIMNTNEVIWKDCNGGKDLKCSSGIPCNKLSWSNHSAVGKLSMRGEFCRIASNS